MRNYHKTLFKKGKLRTDVSYEKVLGVIQEEGFENLPARLERLITWFPYLSVNGNYVT